MAQPCPTHCCNTTPTAKEGRMLKFPGRRNNELRDFGINTGGDST